MQPACSPMHSSCNLTHMGCSPTYINQAGNWFVNLDAIIHHANLDGAPACRNSIA